MATQKNSSIAASGATARPSPTSSRPCSDGKGDSPADLLDDPPLFLRKAADEPTPAGYVDVPRWTAKKVSAQGGMVITPSFYRVFEQGGRAVRVATLDIGPNGTRVVLEFADGAKRPMALLDERDARDPLFNTLTDADRLAIVAHFKGAQQ